MDTVFYIIAGLVFAAVIFLVEGLFSWWSSTRGAEAVRLERRLRLLSAGAHGSGEQISILKKRHLSESEAIERLLQGVPRVHALDRMLAQSGLNWSVARFCTYTLTAFVAVSIGALVLRLPSMLAFALGVLAMLLPLFIVTSRRRRRLAQLETQLPEAADLIGRALRAGHAFPSAMQMAGDEMPDPIGGEMRATFDEINYGVPVNEALMNLATRVPLTDLRYFVIAVLVQRESGGNLAEILGNISYIIRERLKLLGRIRVLSAEGRLSAWILGLLPLAVGAVLSVVNPSYLMVLFTDPAGLLMLGVAAVMSLIGVVWMRAIIKIRV